MSARLVNRRTIVFEQLASAHLVVVGWHVLCGHRIVYLRTAFDAPGPWWFRRLAARAMVRAVRLQEPVYLRFNPAGDMACERTEALYEQVFSRHPLVQQMIRCFQDARIHLAFKKYLNALLEQHCYYVLLGERLRDALDSATFWFAPARATSGALPAVTGGNLPPWGMPFLRGHSLEGFVPPLSFRLPWWSQALGRALELWDNGRVCLETVFLCLWKFLTRRRSPSSRPHYPFAIAIIVPKREFANAIRGCDMLLDGERIRKENTLFVPIARLTAAQHRALTDKGLHVAEHPRCPPGRVWWRVVASTARVIAHLGRSPWWVVRVAAYLARDYGVWSSFLAGYRVDQFVSYNDFTFRHIPRNILLQQSGVRTWYYTDTMNTFSAFLQRDDGLSYRQTIWSYLLYDRYVCWNEVFAAYLASHRQAIGAFMVMGCLWSEHVRLLQDGRLPSTLRERLRAAGWTPAQRLVAVFDNAYVQESITDYRDGLVFARDIGRLLDERPDLFVIWKEKKTRAAPARTNQPMCDLAQCYAELARHPRCYFAAPTTCPSEAIALADLTISFPFTSTGIEALGARVKTLYYDPHAKYRAAYYAAIPGLVAHGYAALRQRVGELLDTTSRVAYDSYLERVIRGTVEPHLDGRALTRFRDALCATDHADADETSAAQATLLGALCT